MIWVALGVTLLVAFIILLIVGVLIESDWIVYIGAGGAIVIILAVLGFGLVTLWSLALNGTLT